MSYVTIYKIEANGDVVEYGEGSNNHVFAPIVWDVLGYKYKYMNKALHPYSLMDPGLKDMWKAWPDPKMPRLEQVLLGATFDFMWCKREQVPELIEACEWFLREHVHKKRMERNYKGEMEERGYDDRALAGDPDEMMGFDGKMQKVLSPRKGIIRCLKEIYEDPTSRGIAFNCCSAVGSFWNVYDVQHVGENEDGTIKHTKDEDCAGHVKDDECQVCGVWHSTACEECKATAFHKEDCSNHEWEGRPWNIDKDTVQPRGEYPGKKAWELSEGLTLPQGNQA